MSNLKFKASFFLAFENLIDPKSFVIGPFSVAFAPLVFREAPYRGLCARERLFWSRSW